MAAKSKHSRSGYPYFPFEVDRSIDLWMSGMDRYAERRLRHPVLRNSALMIREALSLLQRILFVIDDVEKDDPRLPALAHRASTLAEHLRALRLEAEVIELSLELGDLPHLRGGRTTGKVLGDQAKFTKEKVARAIAKLRGKIPDRKLRREVSKETGLSYSRVRDYLPKRR